MLWANKNPDELSLAELVDMAYVLMCEDRELFTFGKNEQIIYIRPGVRYDIEEDINGLDEFGPPAPRTTSMPDPATWGQTPEDEASYAAASTPPKAPKG